MNIKSYGWDEHFEREWNQKCTYDMFPGRIVADYGQMLRVAADAGEFLVNRPLKKLDKDIQLAVGDWASLVNSEEAQSVCILDVLKRKQVLQSCCRN